MNEFISSLSHDNMLVWIQTNKLQHKLTNQTAGKQVKLQLLSIESELELPTFTLVGLG